MQYFTGSKAHNIVLRDRALERGWKLNEYGLFDARRAPDRRRHRRGDLQGARPGVHRRRAARESRRDRSGRRATALPAPDRARGSPGRSAHAHHRVGRPREPRDHGARPRRRAGSSTSRSPITRSRWRWPTASTRRGRWRMPRRIRAYSKTLKGFTVLAGIECDILADGSHGSGRRLPGRARYRRRVGAFARCSRTRAR